MIASSFLLGAFMAKDRKDLTQFWRFPAFFGSVTASYHVEARQEKCPV
jgi:hypothetical protein